MTPRLAVITAAGLGSRLGRNMPKCLVEINGHTILEQQLSLLDELEEVRVVVGYQADVVADLARSLRPDVTIIENAEYQSTTVLQSIYKGLAGHAGPYLSIEGDVIFDVPEFRDFLSECTTPGLLALTPSTTDDALFADVAPIDQSRNRGTVIEFRRSPPALYEWCGLAYLDGSWIRNESTFTFECLKKHLPMRYKVVHSYEIDTPNDFDRAFDGTSNPRFGIVEPRAGMHGRR